MSENYQRCRFWPRCQIHLGDDRPNRFTPENRAEMVELYRDGWPMSYIGQTFGTSPGSVSRIIAVET